jgi:hypothetical protein
LTMVCTSHLLVLAITIPVAVLSFAQSNLRLSSGKIRTSPIGFY